MKKKLQEVFDTLFRSIQRITDKYFSIEECGNFNWTFDWQFLLANGTFLKKLDSQISDSKKNIFLYDSMDNDEFQSKAICNCEFWKMQIFMSTRIKFLRESIHRVCNLVQSL